MTAAAHGAVDAVPDRECPICQSMMQHESFDNGRIQRFRCKRCGYTMKPKSMAFYMTIFIVALLAISTAMFFVGAIFTPPPQTVQPISTRSLG